MSPSLIELLQSFTDPDSEEHLDALHEAISKIHPSTCGHDEFRASFGVFERFPDDDAYGLFWSLLHALEKCRGYEQELLASVRRKPGEFNTRMILRLHNAGAAPIAGLTLDEIVGEILDHPDAPPDVVDHAREYLAGRDAGG